MAMRSVVALLAWNLLFAIVNAEAALPKADSDLITQTAERAAYVESLGEFCDAQDPAGQSAHAQSIAEWKSRNYWSVLLPPLMKEAKFAPAYAQLRAKYNGNLNRDPAKTKQLCGYFDKLLHYPDFDPSANRAADLQRIAGLFSRPTPPPAAEGGTTGTRFPTSEQPRQQASIGAPQQASPMPITGQEMSYGPTKFAAPAGWTLTKNSPELVSFERKGKYNGKSIIAILQAPAASDAGSALLAYLSHQFPALDTKHLVKASSPSGIAAAHIRDYTELKGANRKVQMSAVGLLTGSTLQVAEFLSTADTVDQFDHRKTFEAMVEQWQSSVPGPDHWSPLQPPAGSGGLEALFMGTQLQNTLNPLGGMDLRANRQYLVLRKNGEAYRELPEGGQVLDMDFAVACQQHPRNCGTYKLSGNQIQLQWSGDYGLIEKHDEEMQRTKDGVLSVNLGMCWGRQVMPVHNRRLNGRFTSTFAMTGNTAFSSNSVVSQTFISFRADGTYQKSGFAGASFSNSAGGSTTGGTVSNKKGVQAGQYVIDGFRMVLTPQDGTPPEAFTVLFENSDPQPGAVFINDSAFLSDTAK